MRPLLYAVTAFVLLLPSVASAQTPTRGQGVPFNSPPVYRHFVEVVDLTHANRLTGELSGTVGDHGNEFTVPDGGWVYAIELSERDGRTCTATLHWATIDNGALTTSTRVHSICGNVRTLSGTAGFNVSDPTGNIPSRYATQVLGVMTGFKVCQRTSDGQVKGLEAEGSSFTDLSGPFAVAEGNPMTGRGYLDSFRMSSCLPMPGRTSMCPDGRVVVGLRIAIRTGSPYSSIIGMAPTCGRLQIEN